MSRATNVDRQVLVAFALGLAALTLNLISRYIWGTSYFVPIGNILVFLCSCALGVQGALISFATGIVPETIIYNKPIEFIRLLITCSLLGYYSNKYTRIPGFIVVLALWLGIFAPLAFIGQQLIPSYLQQDLSQIFFTGLCEVLLTIISGLLLLNRNIWALVSSMPRHIPFTSLAIHVVTAISTLAMFGALCVSFGTTSLSSTQQANAVSLESLASIMILGITLPAFLAWRLALMMGNNFQQLFSNDYIGNLSKSFSGLSSEYWRRTSSDKLSQQIQAADEVEAENQDTNSYNQRLDPSQGICSLNRNGTITFMNRKFRRYCEVKSNEVLGKNISCLAMNTVMLHQISSMLDQTFTKGQRTHEVKINQLPEKLKFYELNSFRADAFHDSAIINGPNSIIVTVKDITEKRTVEEHILQTQKLESLGNLMEGIAHNFNNTLTSITGLASFAKRSNDRKQIERSLNDILKTAFAAGSVVGQLLEFANSRPSQMRNINIVALINDRSELLKKVAGDCCELHIETKVETGNAYCDSNLILQALTSLIVNARESYQTEKSKIEISVDKEKIDEDVCELTPGARPGDFIRLRIRDYGSGMSLEVLQKAFEPSYTTKAATGHAGLGLAIVFAIVKAHDGFLTVESNINKGSLFSIYLPDIGEMQTSEQQPAHQQANEIANKDLKGNQEKILVVEKETDIREILTTILTNLSYNVTSCSTEQEALNLSNSNEIDLVLLDTTFPQVKENGLIDKLKNGRDKLPIVLMSASIGNNQIEHSGTPLIKKPFDIETLAQAIKSSLSIQ